MDIILTYIDVSRPAGSHWRPFQEQKSVSLSQPTSLSVVVDVAETMSLKAQNCRILPCPVVCGLLVDDARSLGTPARMEAQVEHG